MLTSRHISEVREFKQFFIVKVQSICKETLHTYFAIKSTSYSMSEIVSEKSRE